MKTQATRVAPVETADALVVVGFVAIAKAPKLLASLGSRIPKDIVPMPIERLSALCYRPQSAPVALQGLVVCVPQRTLSLEDRALVNDLATLIPVLRICDDPREIGRTFFGRCRQSAPRVLRSDERLAYRRPVIVEGGDASSRHRLLLTENISGGGLFVHDPSLSCSLGDRVSFRFPGLTQVPALSGHIRWVRAERDQQQPLGYGCVFTDPLDPAVRRLLSAAQDPQEPLSPLIPGSPGFRNRTLRRS